MNEEHKAKKGSPLEMSEWHTNLKKVNILPDLECVFLVYQKLVYADFCIFSRTYLSR